MGASSSPSSPPSSSAASPSSASTSTGAAAGGALPSIRCKGVSSTTSSSVKGGLETLSGLERGSNGAAPAPLRRRAPRSCWRTRISFAFARRQTNAVRSYAGMLRHRANKARASSPAVCPRWSNHPMASLTVVCREIHGKNMRVGANCTSRGLSRWRKHNRNGSGAANRIATRSAWRVTPGSGLHAHIDRYLP